MDEITREFESDFERSDLQELVASVGDGAIDILANNDVISAFPVLGMLKGIYDITKNYQTNRLAKKIYKLIVGTSTLTSRQKQQFLEEYTEANKEEGAEVLLSLLDRIDNSNKIDVVSRLMASRINNQITIEEFIRLTDALEKLSFIDIQNLEKYKENHYVAGESEMIFTSGLIYTSFITPTSNSYRLSRLGWQFLKYGMGLDVTIPEAYPTENSAYAVLR